MDEQWTSRPVGLLAPTISLAIAVTVLLFPISFVIQYLTIKYMRGRRRNRDTTRGLTILNPQSEDVNIEIVAVHGLGAHPYYTWTHRDRSTRKSTHLLKDLLMKDQRLSHARFLHFAYNSDWLIDAPIESAQEIGVRLAKALVGHRKRYARVPIVFIGHSFGGIVIKEALCDPSSGTEILQDTSGVIFLGTPHRGSPVSGLAARIASLTSTLGSYNGMLLSLRSNISQLDDLSKRFLRHLQIEEETGRKIQLMSFCEQKPTLIRECISIGLIVPWESAAFGGNNSYWLEFPKDHSGLNKCKDANDPLYMALVEQLCKLRPTTVPEINRLQQSVIDRLKPETVSGAIFNFHARNSDEIEESEEPECLIGTRREMLDEIYDWFDEDGPNQKHVYWLRGKAGTGKSTIARTVAREFAERGHLVTSFFFKRGEGDRSSAQRVCSTLASQLVANLPEMAERVQNIMGSDPQLFESPPAIQFRTLIFEPIRSLSPKKFRRIVVVIDALDESDTKKEDIVALIRQLIRLVSAQKPSSTLLLKIFLTSRPDYRTDPTFEHSLLNLRDELRETELEESTKDTIERDIRNYLTRRLGNIHGLLHPLPGKDLWSNPEDIKLLDELVRLANPLFVFAATACRFIEQFRLPGEPMDRLQQILEHKALSELQRTYLPALHQLIIGLTDEDSREVIIEFKSIIGLIINLGDPLPIASISKLLNKPEARVRKQLALLESVFIIPIREESSTPVKIFHESLRDFLLGSGSKEFEVDAVDSHRLLADSCLTLLKKALHRNMCGLETPGTDRNTVTPKALQKALPSEVQYACLYWVYHKIESKIRIRDKDATYNFLETHLLFWLEALSLLGRLNESISGIRRLQSIIHPKEGTGMKAFLREIERLVFSYRSVVTMAPLQLYNAAIVFSPKNSIIRAKFSPYSQFQSWIENPPIVESDWSACIQALEGHQSTIAAIRFSPTGLLASVGDGHEGKSVIKIWDPASGTCLQTLTSDQYLVSELCFLAEGKLASVSESRVNMWDLEQGICSYRSQTSFIVRIAVQDNNCVVVAFLYDMEIWNMKNNSWSVTSRHTYRFAGTTGEGGETALSLDGRWLASPSAAGIRIVEVNPAKGYPTKTLEDPDKIEAMEFSIDGKYLATKHWRHEKVKVWEVATGESVAFDCCARLKNFAFSPNSELLATETDKKSDIAIWNWRRGVCLKTFQTRDPFNSLAFSHNGEWLASGSRDGGPIQIWDLEAAYEEVIEVHEDFITSLTFILDGQKLVSRAQGDANFKIWDSSTGSLLRKIQSSYGHLGGGEAMSTNGQLLAVVHNDGIELRDIETSVQLQDMVWPTDVKVQVGSIAFSPDGTMLVICDGKTTVVTLWDTVTGISRFHHLRDVCEEVDVSPQNRQVAFAQLKSVHLWNPLTDEELELKSELRPSALQFSENGSRLAVVEGGPMGLNGFFRYWSKWKISIWNTGTGECIFRSSEGEDNYFPPHTTFINMDFCLDTKAPIGRSPGPWLKEYYISFDGIWVMRDSAKILWLPPDYRPYTSALSGSRIAIGTQRGRVVFLNLPPTHRIDRLSTD